LAIPLESLSAEERYSLEPATEETPDKAFDRRWAAALVERVFERLAEEQGAAGKAELFNRLRPFLGRDVERGDYESLAIELALPTNTVAKMVQRLRLRARELLREEAAQTVATLSDVDQELRDLFR
jgi:RNA polymerase sigma-70 factor (ECF subfamily)